MHAAFGETPSRIRFCKSIQIPDFMFGVQQQQTRDPGDYVSELRNHHHHESVRNKIRLTTKHMKDRYDFYVNSCGFQKDDLAPM